MQPISVFLYGFSITRFYNVIPFLNVCPLRWNRTTMLLYSELRFAILSIHISTHFSQAFNNMKQVLFFFFFFDEWFRNEECRDPHPGRLYWAR